MATSQITVIPIIPKNLSDFDKQKYAKRIFKIVAEETQIFENMYNRVGKGFEEKPVFKREMKTVNGDLEGTTSTGSKPFVYIEGIDGKPTKQTYQGVPTDDWRPRTTVGVLGIKGRQGGLKFVNKQRSGKEIEPRGWSKEIAKQREKPFAKKIEDAMK